MLNITQASVIISAPGTYTLQNDIYYYKENGYAIDVQCSGVVIDLNGFSIINANAEKSTTAIGIHSRDQSNVIVQNGSISNFMYGVLLQDTTPTESGCGGNIVRNLEVYDSTFRGISVEGNNNVIEGCLIDGVSGTTLYANAFACGIESKGIGATIGNNVVKEIYAQSKGEGLGISISGFGDGTFLDNNIIQNVQATDFRSFGIWVGGYSYNVIAQNNQITNYTYGQGWSSVASGTVTSNLTFKTDKLAIFTGDVVSAGGNVSFFSERADTAIGDRLNNHLVLKGGNDIAYGQEGDDLIFGEKGDDVLYGDGGNDNLVGGAGDDQLVGGGGADLLQGGEGFDYASYRDATSGLKVSLSDPTCNTGIATGDQFVGIEGLLLSDYDDFAYGSLNGDSLSGFGGRDFLFGLNGNDVLRGGEGHDHLFGGWGADVIDGGSGFDYARFDDSLYSAFRVSLQRPALNTGPAAGDTYVSIEGLILSNENDVAYGNGENNYIYGRMGNDTLYGYEGKDNLFGEEGADRFMFNTKPSLSNTDTLSDFEPGIDKIGLAQFYFGSAKTDLGTVNLEVGASIKASTTYGTVLFDTDTKLLSFDADGSGLTDSVPIAVLPSVSSLGHADLFFI